MHSMEFFLAVILISGDTNGLACQASHTTHVTLVTLHTSYYFGGICSKMKNSIYFLIT